MTTTPSGNDLILEAKSLSFSYTQEQENLVILDELDLSVSRGESVAVVGASGSGKSTLLHILAGLDLPQKGEIHICGESITGASDRQRTLLRNRLMGFVYQFHHLLPEFSARENVAMPLLIRGEAKSKALSEADRLLDRVGLASRTKHRPSEMSGGERQRTAIARALVSNPSCLLADEPTGNLDEESAANAFQLMQEIVSEQQGALIIVTHDMQLAQRMDRRYNLSKGKLISA